jgi:thiol-disulfide isomerase/thioredoxin
VVPCRAGQTAGNGAEAAEQLLARERGKVVVFVFVRTDCPIANRYAPLLQKMQKEYGARVVWRLVFPDSKESQEKVQEYLREYGYEIPAMRDARHALVKKTMAKVTPEAAVFGKQGELLYHGRIDNLYEHIGQARRSATTQELREAIEAGLRGERPQVASVDGVGCYIADFE